MALGAVGSGVVKTSSVGRFGRWRRPARVAKSPAHQLLVGKQADRELGAGPAQLDRVEAPLGQRRRRALQRVMRSSQAAVGVRLVEPQHVQRSAQSRSYASASSSSG